LTIATPDLRGAPDKVLRAQAFSALRELLAGLEQAHRLSGGELLRGQEHGIHAGLVSVLLRWAFLLFAEAKGLLLDEPGTDAAGSSLSAIHAQLRAGAARPGRAMDERHGAWEGVAALFRRLHNRVYAAAGHDLAPHPGRLFDAGAHPFLEGRAADGPRGGPASLPRIPDSAVLRALDCLLRPAGEPLCYGDLDVEHLGTLYEGLMGFEVSVADGLILRPSEERRRLGAHYTSRALARLMVERALDPLLQDEMPPHCILELKVCDPAMGSGAFLVEACRRIARHLVKAWARTGTTPALPSNEDAWTQARRLVAQHCLYGVDKNPFAVDLTRLSLWLESLSRDLPFTFLDHAVRLGDSIVGFSREQIADRWAVELPEVFSAGRGGFDAVVGNPPWVSYAGRAAQPLAAELRRVYLKSPAFAGYRNLQGVFVHVAASVLRQGGRLGLVLPTSMSDLGGYEPSRRAHDELCVCDAELPDFGDAFDDVFQPSMGLLSTRRASKIELRKTGPWPLERKDLDAATKTLLDQLDALPKLPPRLFGERGFQTSGEDVRQLRPLAGPEGACSVALRVGSDVAAFLRRPAQLHCDPAAFGKRFRPAEQWQAVKLLIRQTARFPMAALSDGAAFRNSVLAGFADEVWSELFLLAYLNSAPVRWYHYMRHRDARQGMPQLKIAHLRALPMPPREAPSTRLLERLGRELGERNTGISAAEQALVDELAADCLGLESAARQKIAAWAAGLAG
jgi:hypothetical protein